MQPAALTAALKAEAARLGFELAGACSAVAPAGFADLENWLAAGYAGEMQYLAERRQAYEHPQHVLAGAKSILMLAMNYYTAEPPPTPPGAGRVASYAWGDADYHDLIHARLKALTQFHLSLTPTAHVRGVVDTAPLLEREFAQLTGLGWRGKNTLLLNKRRGSYFFLAALLTDQALAYDVPHEANHCGQCTACLDACPTGAFPQPYVLDARKCISYLTIELRAPIPAELRPGIGDWLFGCDICQQVCPWNQRHAQPTAEQIFQPRPNTNPLPLCELFELDDVAFRQMFRNTPLWRSKRRGVLRNAAIVLGNQSLHSESNDFLHRATSALCRGLQDSEPLIRGASAWALGRLQNSEARTALRSQLDREMDAQVRREIELALEFSPEAPCREHEEA